MSNFADQDGAPSAGDSFTETTSRSWFSRIGSSLTGMLFGPVVVLIAVGLLFWNEGRAVDTARSLQEGAGLVVSVPAGAVDPTREGRLVHVAGSVVAPERLRDRAFGIEADGLRLIRRVEAFQWKETSRSETRKKLGGGEETVTTHDYALDWTDRPVDGSAFKHPDGHRNPPVSVQGETVSQTGAKIGAFALTPQQIAQIGAARPRPVEPSEEAALRRALGPSTVFRIADGRLHLGFDPTHPRLGDVRVSWEVAATPDATVVARQSGAGFTAYPTSNGRTIEILRNGTVAPDRIFSDAQSGNTMLTWGLRIGGILLLTLGFSMILGPLSVLADVVPFIGDLVGGASGLVALAGACLVGSVTIALAWFAHRPLLALAVLAGGIGIAFVVRRLAGRRRPAAPTGTAAA